MCFNNYVNILNINKQKFIVTEIIRNISEIPHFTPLYSPDIFPC